MNESDIVVILYPNKSELKQVIILDPFDSRVEMYQVDSLPEAKEVLRQNLPFCDQHHEPILHLGVAYVTDWGSLRENNIIILYPNKNEVKSIIIVDPNNNKVELQGADSIDIKRLKQYIEWENLAETKLVINEPGDIDEVIG